MVDQGIGVQASSQEQPVVAPGDIPDHTRKMIDAFNEVAC